MDIGRLILRPKDEPSAEECFTPGNAGSLIVEIVVFVGVACVETSV
jgi:hypothetical protein